jgi:DMSO/TMAO reductase YedYZ molybdopterin-dependent catalytic subunit
VVTRVRIDPKGTIRRIPLAPHEHVKEITPNEELFMLAHLGIPQIDAADWSVEITGLVERPAKLDLSDLRAFPKTSIQTVHECAGNPLTPEVPARRVANVVWGGVELTHILDAVGVQEEASFLWSYGLDWGEFEGESVEHYLKDLPLWRLADGGVIVAYELNGEPLPVEHGFPARLLVPGFYGTNSVKWLRRLELADRRAEGLFTTRYYNDRIAIENTDTGVEHRPVWEIAPESIIVSPAPEETLANAPREVWGWAWASSSVAAVEFSDDDGATWQEAEVASRTQWSWQRFRIDWTPQKTGRINLASRAYTATGDCQPASGHRNAIYAVPVDVVLESEL